jgi:uncharacterized protein (DUF305 family)
MTRLFPRLRAAALLAAGLSACATAPAAAQAGTGSPRWSPADIAFMQGMIGHHAQALRMTALVPGRSARADVRLLAERIEAGQRSEIAQMRQWLRTRGLDTAAMAGQHQHQHAGGADDHGMMPGMLTEPQFEALAAATGAGFDRLFLESMIRHHEGAVTMVATLFFTNGAGQEPEVFRLASDVDADQRAEIARMRAMLGAPPAPR